MIHINYFPSFWLPEHKTTNTTATPATISSYPVLCIFECLGPILTRGGGLKRGGKRWTPGEIVWIGQVRGGGRESFYVNIKCLETPFRSVFLLL